MHGEVRRLQTEVVWPTLLAAKPSAEEVPVELLILIPQPVPLPDRTASLAARPAVGEEVGAGVEVQLVRLLWPICWTGRSAPLAARPAGKTVTGIWGQKLHGLHHWQLGRE